MEIGPIVHHHVDVSGNILMILYTKILIIMPLPYVAVGCGQLSDPQNGRVRLTGTNVGSLASYACGNGFNLIGNRRRVCQQTSQWSGDAPTCQREYCIYIYIISV